MEQWNQIKETRDCGLGGK